MKTTPKRRRLDRLRALLVAARVIEPEPCLDPSAYPPPELQAQIALGELEPAEPSVATRDAALRLVGALQAARDADRVP